MRPIHEREEAERRRIASRDLFVRIGREPPKPVQLPPYGTMRPDPELTEQGYELARMRELLGKRVWAADIITEVCRRSGYSVIAIVGHDRSQSIARYRQEISYLVRALTTLSLPELGRIMDRDHTSILHQVSVFRERHKLPDPDKISRTAALRILVHGVRK